MACLKNWIVENRRNGRTCKERRIGWSLGLLCISLLVVNIERLMSKIVSVDKQIFLLKKKANMRKKPVVYIGELTVDKVEVVDEKGKK
jgi:hypothetical protein